LASVALQRAMVGYERSVFTVSTYLPELAEDEATALRASAEVLAQTIAGGLDASEAQAWLLGLANGSR
jgi:L-lactate dehydrogenase